MNKIIALSFAILAASCANQEWNEEYYILPQDPDEFLQLNCTAERAIEIAFQAVEEKYPKLMGRLKKSGFSQFSTPYSSEYGGQKKYGELKSIFGYKGIEHGPGGAKFYEESVEVHLSIDCDVLNVNYFKGKVELAY